MTALEIYIGWLLTGLGFIGVTLLAIFALALMIMLIATAFSQ